MLILCMLIIVKYEMQWNWDHQSSIKINIYKQSECRTIKLYTIMFLRIIMTVIHFLCNYHQQTTLLVLYIGLSCFLESLATIQTSLCWYILFYIWFCWTNVFWFDYGHLLWSVIFCLYIDPDDWQEDLNCDWLGEDSGWGYQFYVIE